MEVQWQHECVCCVVTQIDSPLPMVTDLISFISTGSALVYISAVWLIPWLG